MDITKIMNSFSSPFYSTIEDCSTLSSNNNASAALASMLGIKISNKTDAVEAIKLDPAVLEVRPRDEIIQKKSGRNPLSHSANSNKDNCAKNIFPTYENTILGHQLALQSLTAERLSVVLSLVDKLRTQRSNVWGNAVNKPANKLQGCAFCKKNGAPVLVYSLHRLRDRKGRVQCPVLRAYICPKCGATGDTAHTVRYCPLDLYADLGIL